MRHLNLSQSGFGPREAACADRLIELALEEDFDGRGDLTAEATIPFDAQSACVFVARQPGVLCGLPIVERLAVRFGLSDDWSPALEDGDMLKPGTRIARLAGSTRAILGLERTALNFLQRLSGVASLTARFVQAVEGTSAAILDTRKTTPGWRALEKYAVRAGGGVNHRMGLYDAVLIKDNHRAWLAAEDDADPIALAIDRARRHAPCGATVEIEVDTLEQFDRALAKRPDIILLDNFGLDTLAEAVRLRHARAPEVRLEASGGIRESTARAVALTGVDRISVGALTHSPPALDIGLDEADMRS